MRCPKEVNPLVADCHRLQGVLAAIGALDRSHVPPTGSERVGELGQGEEPLAMEPPRLLLTHAPEFLDLAHALTVHDVIWLWRRSPKGAVYIHLVPRAGE